MAAQSLSMLWFNEIVYLTYIAWKQEVDAEELKESAENDNRSYTFLACYLWEHNSHTW